MKQWFLALIWLNLWLVACLPTAVNPPETVLPVPTAEFVPIPQVEGTAELPPPDSASLLVTTWPNPDGNGWVVQSENGVNAPTALEDGRMVYYTRLTASNEATGQQWVVVEEWLPTGLGFTTPELFEWTNEGRAFFYTNLPHVDGCAWAVNGWDLIRFDLQTGQSTPILPDGGLFLALTQGQQMVAFGGGQEIVVQQFMDSPDTQQTRYSYSPNYTTGPMAWSVNDRLAAVLATAPCGPVEESVVLLIDPYTQSQTAVVVPAPVRFAAVEWLTTDTLALTDEAGKAWRLDINSGELTNMAATSFRPAPEGLVTTSDLFMPLKPSPNGRYVVEMDWTSKQTLLRDLVTGEATLLPHSAVAMLFHSWVSNEQLLVGAWLSEEAPRGQFGYLALYDIPSQTLNVLDETAASYTPAALAPDGQQVAYDREGQAWLYNLATGESRPFDPSAFAGWPSWPTAMLGNPAWSPDGRYLVWEATAEGVLPDGGLGVAIARFDLAAREVVVLAAWPMGMGGWLPAAEWSADSQWLAIQRFGHNPEEGGVYLLGLAGEVVHLGGSTTWGAWQPEGQGFVYGRHFSFGTAEPTLENYWMSAPTAAPILLDLPPTERVIGWR